MDEPEYACVRQLRLKAAAIVGGIAVAGGAPGCYTPLSDAIVFQTDAFAKLRGLTVTAA